MNKQDLEQIKNKLQEFRDQNARGCAKVDPNNGDQGACYAYSVYPLDKLIEKINIELELQSAKQVAQVHSDINEKLFGYFKL